MDDVLLFTISLAVSAVGMLLSWAAYRRRGAASGLRGAAWSTVPLAAYLTGLEKFLADLVFSPVKWAGVALFGLGVVLYMTSGVMLRGRSAGAVEDGTKDAGNAAKKDRKKKTRPAAPKGRTAKGEIEERKETPAGDPDLAEIEKILRNRGIE